MQSLTKRSPMFNKKSAPNYPGWSMAKQSQKIENPSTKKGNEIETGVIHILSMSSLYNL